jgi:hypothetical protein
LRATVTDPLAEVRHHVAMSRSTTRGRAITRRTLRGDDARVIQRAAGHEKVRDDRRRRARSGGFSWTSRGAFFRRSPTSIVAESMTDNLTIGKDGVPKGIPSVADTARSRGNCRIVRRSSDRDEAVRLASRDASDGPGIRDHDPNRQAARVAK